MYRKRCFDTSNFGVCALSHSVLFNSLQHDGNSPAGSPVHGIFQTRMLELVAISSPRRPSQPRDWRHISRISCIAGRFFTTSTTWEALKFGGEGSKKSPVQWTVPSVPGSLTRPYKPLATHSKPQRKGLVGNTNSSWLKPSYFCLHLRIPFFLLVLFLPSWPLPSFQTSYSPDALFVSWL